MKETEKQLSEAVSSEDNGSSRSSYMTKFNENITDTLDRVYENEPSTIEPVFANAQSLSLEKESW